MNLDILKKIGLSNGEVKIYGTLLELGLSSVTDIHENVGIDRRNIYDILNKLIERGLVSYVEENKKKVFKTASPEKILTYIEEKRNGLDSLKKEINTLIPAMNDIYATKNTKLHAEIFRGREGMKAVWEDLLKYDTIYWIGSGMYVPTDLPAYWNDWNKRRMKKHIGSYHLFRSDKRVEVKTRKGFEKNKISDWKFLPPEFSGNPTVTVSFGNKVAQMLLGEQMNVIVIESKELADNYKDYHQFLWNTVAER